MYNVSHFKNSLVNRMFLQQELEAHVQTVIPQSSSAPLEGPSTDLLLHRLVFYLWIRGDAQGGSSLRCDRRLDMESCVQLLPAQGIRDVCVCMTTVRIVNSQKSYLHKSQVCRFGRTQLSLGVQEPTTDSLVQYLPKPQFHTRGDIIYMKYSFACCSSCGSSIGQN